MNGFVSIVYTMVSVCFLTLAITNMQLLRKTQHWMLFLSVCKNKTLQVEKKILFVICYLYCMWQDQQRPLTYYYVQYGHTLNLTRELICVSWCKTSVAATGVRSGLEPWITWENMQIMQIIQFSNSRVKSKTSLQLTISYHIISYILYKLFSVH